MQRLGLLLICVLSFPGVAFSHAGHLVGVAGHDHVVAGAAIGIAIAVGVAGILSGRKDRDEPDEEDISDEPELSEA